LMVPRWIGPVGLSLTEDKLVLTMAEESGGIWVIGSGFSRLLSETVKVGEWSPRRKTCFWPLQ